MLIYLDIKITHLKIAPLVGNLEVGNLEGIRPAAKGCKVFSLRKINKVKTWLPILCLFSVAEKS